MLHVPGTSHYHLTRLPEMTKIYWCHSLASIGGYLVLIFIPIFLLKSGYSFRAVLVYVLLSQVFSALTQYHVSRLFAHLTPHKLMVAGQIWFMVLFGLLFSLVSVGWPLALLAFAWAMNRNLYWTAFHYVFSMSRHHQHGGRQIAGVTALSTFGATIAPAIGGIVASLFGMNYVYIAAILIIFLAVSPMLDHAGGPARIRLSLSWSMFNKMRRDVAANFFNGTVIMAEQNIWPLFVYFIVTSYAGVGLLSTVIAFAGILVTLYVGRREEIKGESYYINQGVSAYSLASIGRILASNSSHVFGLNFLSGVGRSLYVTPFMNRYYTNSDGAHRLGYITIMEGAFSVGSASYMLGLLILSLFISQAAVLAIGLAVVAISSLGVHLMR
jgi:hypothetical protein